MTVKTEIKNVKETWQIDLHSFYVGLAISLALHLLLINLCLETKYTIGETGR